MNVRAWKIIRNFPYFPILRNCEVSSRFLGGLGGGGVAYFVLSFFKYIILFLYKLKIRCYTRVFKKFCVATFYARSGNTATTYSCVWVQMIMHIVVVIPVDMSDLGLMSVPLLWFFIHTTWNNEPFITKLLLKLSECILSIQNIH